MLLTAEGVAKISDMRVAAGLVGGNRPSDASQLKYLYIPAGRPEEGPDAPGTVSPHAETRTTLSRVNGVCARRFRTLT